MIRIRQRTSTPGRAVILLAVGLLFAAPLFAATDTPDNPSTQLARRILIASGIRGGLVVQIGCADPQLTAELRGSDAFIVQALDSNPKNVTAAREHIRALGCYGPVSARTFDGQTLPYADNLVNLVVSSSRCGVSDEEIKRVLAPLGAAVRIEADNSISVTLRKPYPDDIDEWTHYLHDAGNNAVAQDDRVAPPKYLQWKAPPTWCRSHEFSSSVLTMISAKGRLFAIIDEGIIGQPRGVPALWTLIARDAFNGVLLWRRPCALINPHALTAIGDKVYVTLTKNGPLSILDAATGKTLHTCEQTGRVSEIAFSDNRLILATQLKGAGPHVVAANPEDGSIIWRRPAGPIARNTLIAGAGRICYTSENKLTCLSLETGDQLWQADTRNFNNRYAVLYKGVVFMTGGSTRAFSLEDGKFLWTGPDGDPHARTPPGLFGAAGLIWTAWDRVDPRSFLWQDSEEVRNGYDPLTGEVRKTIRVEHLVTPGHHIRCYPPKATERYLLLNKRGVEFFDLVGDNHMRANWTRGACGYGMLPANGLLYAPPSQCFCYQGVLLAGLNALSAQRNAGKTSRSPIFLRGPAYEQISKRRAEKQSPEDWPTYRHDPQRSGSVGRSLPVELESLWRTSICPPSITPAKDSDPAPTLRERARGQLTPPVAAQGRIFVAQPDSHAVHAIDAQSGKHLWTFTAGGRVDSPPTIYGDLCIFGCTDGCVYCITTANGALVWRFRAAPDDLQICVESQPESAWPVHGSVLVRDNKVYCTAGISTYLDGGIRLYALDPHTGQVVHERLFRSEEPDITKYGGRPFDMAGSRSDILVAGEKDIYLFQNRFDSTLTPKPMPRVTKLGDRMGEAHLAVTGGFLDKTWFNRAYWTYGERWPGYYFTYRAPKSGQILVFDENATYALKVYTERVGHSPEFKPGTGYQLIADRNTTKPVLDAMDVGAEKGRGFSRTELPIWVKNIPIRAHGLLLASDKLYVAGAPDLEPQQDAYEAMIGKRGALFQVVSTQNGKTLDEFPIAEVPVFDGLIAAGDRLYMSTMQGSLICFGKKK